MGIDILRHIVATGMAHDPFDCCFIQMVVAGHGDERMPGVMGPVVRKVQFFHYPDDNIPQIDDTIPGADMAFLIRHDQVRAAGEFGNRVKVLHERKDAVCYGDRPVFAGFRFDAANHISFFQVHIFQFHGAQFCLTHAGVNLDQQNFNQLVSGISPQGAQLIRSIGTVHFRLAQRIRFDEGRIIFIDQVIGQGVIKDPAEDRQDRSLAGRVHTGRINDLLHVHSTYFADRHLTDGAGVVLPVLGITDTQMFGAAVLLVHNFLPDIRHGRLGGFKLFRRAVISI